MSGKAFVTAFLSFMLGFFLLAVLFNLYPPAGTSFLTLAGLAIYVALAIWVTRRVARK